MVGRIMEGRGQCGACLQGTESSAGTESRGGVQMLDNSVCSQ